MVLVDKDTLEIIKDNNRQFKARLTFSFLSVKEPTVIKIKAPNAQRGSVVDKIVYPYMSHIKNRFFIDGNFGVDKNTLPDVADEYNRVFPSVLNRYGGVDDFVQVEKQDTTYVGYIGKMAGADGSVNDEITLWMPITDIENITLRTNPDRIIENAKIEIYANNISATPEKEHVIEGNTKDTLIIPLACKNASHLKLIITKATPNKRVWVVSFFAGFEYEMDESQIVKIKYQQKKTENKEGSIGRVYFNTVDLTLSNIERIFDKENTLSSIVDYLTTTATFTILLTMQQGEMTKPFVLNLGTFAVLDFTSGLSKADATIKGACFLSSKKDEPLNLGIIENKSAYYIFREVALRLGLEATGIDNALKSINISLLPLNDTASKILNKLCSMTNVFCTVRGNVLVATLLKSKHSLLRYPQRYFGLNEYKETGSQKAVQLIPNVVNLSYNAYQYENGIFIKTKHVYKYGEHIKQQTLPHEWYLMDLGEYMHKVFHNDSEEMESLKTPSYEVTFNEAEIPENFHHVEISDKFLYRHFEYKINLERNSQGKVNKITVKFYWYATPGEYADLEQCSIFLCVKEKPAPSLINSTDYIVYPHGDEYIKNDELLLSPQNTNDINEIERRNMPNVAETFSVECTGDIDISNIEIGNYFQPGQFEYYFTKSPKGINVKVWNYMDIPQTLTVNIYGVRLEKESRKTTLQARNEANIAINGEVVKNIHIDGVSDKESALEILNTAMRYYKEFIDDLSYELWADPRIELYDYIGVKKLRYPSYSQGIVDEIELEYQGYLKQKVKIKETRKHNRDCRVFAGFVLTDRPMQDDTQITYV
ncbi:MAG: hypothetical protein P1P64_03525 [Treponemataceae bacterium]